MSHPHRPRKGSMGYSPRKRSRRSVPHFNSWPDYDGEPRLQSFPGFKAGMTHAIVIDYRKESVTAGGEVAEAVTVVETPPITILAVRTYRSTPYGLQVISEKWGKTPKTLKRRLPVPKNSKGGDIMAHEVVDVRVLTCSRPDLVPGLPSKTPDVMETRVAGGSIEDRIEYAKGLLGKDLTIDQVFKAGQMVDVGTITKGKGFGGHTKRWGVKLLDHKNSKHRRMIGNLGPFSPGYVRPTVPQAGQIGYHHRVDFNKRILRMADPSEEGMDPTPLGGFLRYGKLVNAYVILHGSIGGPTKRLVRLRDPTRFRGRYVQEIEMPYLSTASKQGV